MNVATAIHLDRARNEPLYQQIVAALSDQIRRGVLEAGLRLPPTRALASALSTHRNTVVRAYEALEAAGWVESHVGRGTFVSARAVPETGRLAWGSLVSSSARTETLGRLDRLMRSAPRTSAQTINLARMQPPDALMPHEALSTCLSHVLREVGPASLGYAPRDGVPRLREALASHLADRGLVVSAEDILVTTGSQQGLDLVTRALVDRGDTVLVEASTYTGALNCFSAAGARLEVVEHGRGLVDALRRRSGAPASAPAKAVYLMPNCHNPTGRMIEPALRPAIAAWSTHSGVPIVEDDYAADLRLNDDPDPPALRSLNADVIYVGTFSKKLIPALRVGFVVCPPELRTHLVWLKHAMDLGTSALLQHALAEFLERGEFAAHLTRITAEYRRRFEALMHGLQEQLPEDVRIVAPARGVSIWLELPEAIRPEALFVQAQRAGVLVTPSSLSSVGQGGHAGVRLTFCAEPVERLAEGAKRLGRALHTMMTRRDDPGGAHPPGLGVV